MSPRLFSEIRAEGVLAYFQFIETEIEGCPEEINQESAFNTNERYLPLGNV